jgi:hypothetical protein
MRGITALVHSSSNRSFLVPHKVALVLVVTKEGTQRKKLKVEAEAAVQEESSDDGVLMLFIISFLLLSDRLCIANDFVSKDNNQRARYCR